MKYRWEVSGTAAGGQTWTTHGDLDEIMDDNAFGFVMRSAFIQLSKGEALYGHPGVGCNGPYKITRFEIESAELPEQTTCRDLLARAVAIVGVQRAMMFRSHVEPDGNVTDAGALELLLEYDEFLLPARALLTTTET